jgi:ketosteroid isomerase-like protein
MSAAENKQIVQAMYAALERGSLRGYFAPMADDVRLTVLGTTRFSGTWTSKADYERLLRSLTPLFDGRIILAPANFIAEGDYVVAQLRGASTTVAGRPYNNWYCIVFQFTARDGQEGQKIIEIMQYLDTELVTATFGK